MNCSCIVLNDYCKYIKNNTQNTVNTMPKITKLASCLIILSAILCSLQLRAQNQDTSDTSITVPEKATAEEYLLFVGDIGSGRYSLSDEKALELIDQASNKILELPDLTSAQAWQAAAWQVQGIFFRGEKTPDKIDALCKKVTTAGFPELVGKIRQQMLVYQIISSVESGNIADFNVYIKDFDTLIVQKGTSLTDDDADNIGSVCRAARFIDSGKREPELFWKFSELLSKSSDIDVARRGKTMLGIRRRLELIGKPIRIEGKKLDETPFDYSAYKGKVVLVEFWATWCPPCCGEIPHLKSMYDKYHDKGFEIIGISLDRDLNELIKFVDEKKVPWVQLASFDTNIDGESITDYYGASSIPQLFLVGTDGNVISIEARGETLERLLEKQFELSKQEGK